MLPWTRKSRWHRSVSFAVLKGHLEIVRLLLDARADTGVISLRSGKLSRSPRKLERGNSAAAFDAGANEDEQHHCGHTALHDGSSQRPCGRRTVAVGSWCRQGGLIHAARNDQVDIAGLLLEADRGVHSRFGYTALVPAAENGRDQIVPLLSAQGSQACGV